LALLATTYGAWALAFRIEHFVAPHRRDQNRMRLPLPEQRDAGVDRRHIIEHARTQTQRAPSDDVLVGTDLVVGARRAEGKGDRRHLFARPLFQGVEIDTIQGIYSGQMTPRDLDWTRSSPDRARKIKLPGAQGSPP
jgi:hypothetical protein